MESIHQHRPHIHGRLYIPPLSTQRHHIHRIAEGDLYQDNQDRLPHIHSSPPLLSLSTRQIYSAQHRAATALPLLPGFPLFQGGSGQRRSATRSLALPSLHGGCATSLQLGETTPSSVVISSRRRRSRWAFRAALTGRKRDARRSSESSPACFKIRDRKYILIFAAHLSRYHTISHRAEAARRVHRHQHRRDSRRSTSSSALRPHHQ